MDRLRLFATGRARPRRRCRAARIRRERGAALDVATAELVSVDADGVRSLRVRR